MFAIVGERLQYFIPFTYGKEKNYAFHVLHTYSSLYDLAFFVNSQLASEILLFYAGHAILKGASAINGPIVANDSPQ